MSRQNLEAFARTFLRDTSLQDQLRNIDDQDQFIQRAVELGREQGYEFTVEEVKEALIEKAVRDTQYQLGQVQAQIW